MKSVKSELLLLIAWAALICTYCTPLVAQDEKAPADAPADATQVNAEDQSASATPETKSEPNGTPAETDTKSRLEESKLREEVKKLRLGNEVKTNWSEWLTYATSAVGLAIAWATFILNRLQARKLQQELTINKRKHLLEVFEALGDTEPQVRMGAVAVLARWLREDGSGLDEQENPSRDVTPATSRSNADELREMRSRRRTITSILVAVTKFEETEEIQKYIADNLVLARGAIVEDNETVCDDTTSPLKDDSFDFQGAKLTNAWWKRVDGRNVDFYAATLQRASLREGFLSEAIFSKGNLEHAVFENANLADARFKHANLRNSRMAGAHLAAARLDAAQGICWKKTPIN